MADGPQESLDHQLTCFQVTKARRQVGRRHSRLIPPVRQAMDVVKRGSSDESLRRLRCSQRRQMQRYRNHLETYLRPIRLEPRLASLSVQRPATPTQNVSLH